MKITVSVTTAETGSIGGHTKPSTAMLDAVRGRVGTAIEGGLLIDGLTVHTGDDIAIIMSHRHGIEAASVHRFAWPVAINTAVTGPYCLPIVSCLAFSMDAEGRFARECVDVFGNVAWDPTRLTVRAKADEWRRQGFIGPTLAPRAEMSHSGIVEALALLEHDFELRPENEV